MGLENLKSNKGLIQKPNPIPEKVSTVEVKKSVFGTNNLTSTTEITKMTSGTNNLESTIFPNRMRSGTNNLQSPTSTIFIGHGLAKIS